MEQLRKIVAKVMEIPLEEATGDFSRSRTEWDSFNHLSLLSAIETEMGITFELEEVESIKNIADIETIICRH